MGLGSASTGLLSTTARSVVDLRSVSTGLLRTTAGSVVGQRSASTGGRNEDARAPRRRSATFHHLHPFFFIRCLFIQIEPEEEVEDSKEPEVF